MVDGLDGVLLCLNGNHVWKRSVYFFEIYRTLRRERVLDLFGTRMMTPF